MAQQISDRRDIDFVLHEQLDVDQFSKNERYAEFNKKTVDLIVSEARNYQNHTTKSFSIFLKNRKNGHFY